MSVSSMPAAATSTTATPTPVDLVPAVVDGKQIYIECPSWCTIDHVASPAPRLDDLVHQSEPVDLYVPRHDAEPEQVIMCTVSYWPYLDAKDAGPFLVVDTGGVTTDLVPAEAQPFLDSLVSFAGKFRNLIAAAQAAAEVSA